MVSRHYVFKTPWKRYLACVFDFLGSIFTFWVSRNQPISPLAVKKILLIRIDHLGDALLLRPVLLALRRSQPKLQIHLLTTLENRPVFQLDSFIDRVISLPVHWFQKNVSFLNVLVSYCKLILKMRSEHYDAVIDFRGDVRVNLLMVFAGIPIRLGYGDTGGGWMLTHERLKDEKDHQVILNQKILCDWIRVDDNLMNLPVSYPVDTVSKLNEQISKVVKWPYAVVHMGAGNPLKEWPVDCFKTLLEKVCLSGLVKVFFLVGSSEERKRTTMSFSENIIDLRGRTDLHELACLLDGALVFIGNDSGPAHIAAAQGIPVIVLASSTNDIQVWHPWTKKLSIFSAPQGETISVEKVAAGLFSLVSHG